MYIVTFTSSFKTSYKAYKHNAKIKGLLETIMGFLTRGDLLPVSFLDHSLTGRWVGYREMHLLPDVLVVYRKNETQKLITLTHIGSHSTLFG